MTELDELIGFLSHQSPQIKQHAAQLIEGLTGSPEGITQLSLVADTLIPSLLRLVAAEPATARAALVSLVNLAQEPASQLKLLELNGVGRCVDYIKERNCAHPDLLVMLLANLTAAAEGAAALVQTGQGQLEGLNVAMLLQLFLAPVPPGTLDAYQHVATILPNVTRFQSARRLLLEEGRGTLRALASQLVSPSELRRRGCSGAIKNCCFGGEEDGTVDLIAGETEALTDILDVLCNTSEHKADAVVKGNLAEAVLCLAKAPEARKKLWAVGAVEALRKGYEYEEDRVVCDAMEKTAELFLSDGFEPAEEGAETLLPSGPTEPRQEAGAEDPGRLVHIEELK